MELVFFWGGIPFIILGVKLQKKMHKKAKCNMSQKSKNGGLMYLVEVWDSQRYDTIGKFWTTAAPKKVEQIATDYKRGCSSTNYSGLKKLIRKTGEQIVEHKEFQIDCSIEF